MNRKIKHGFLGFLHCLIEGLPLIVLFVYCLVNILNGFTAVDINGVASESVNYTSNFELENAFIYFNANYNQVFTIVNVDFFSMMGITSTNAYIHFTNWYLNYLINIELVLFLPEVLLFIIQMFKKLVASWTNKIGESY